jgi:asparagine synthase (glutamine-hydrolysing)
MSGLAGYISWQHDSVDVAVINRMMEVISHRALDGQTTVAVENVALGHGLVALRHVEKQQTHLIWHPDGMHAIVADAQIHNQSALYERLTHHDQALTERSDAALLLALYREFGPQMVDWVYGDFAFVIWDKTQHQLFAARDPFGIRPLFYHAGKTFFAFASEPKQLLALSEISPEINSMIVGEYLFDNMQDLEQTFFQSVNRLKPGCYLIAAEKNVEQVYFWHPTPRIDMQEWTRQAYYEGFRHQLMQALKRRLRTDYPVGIELSGGFDSTSLVVLAEALKQQGESLPVINTISRIFGNAACDESDYIKAASQLVSFAHSQLDFANEDVISPDDLFADVLELDSPFSDWQRNGFEYSGSIVNSIGGRTLITGVGGDHITHLEYHLDLGIQRRFLTLLREAWFLGRSSEIAFHLYLLEGLRLGIPKWIKRLYRQVRPSAKVIPPHWITAQFMDLYNSYPYPPKPPETDFPDRLQNEILKYVQCPDLTWSIEAIEAQSAYRGFYPQHPFLDRELVEYVLSIPLDGYLPAHHWRPLIFHALADDLPSNVRMRRNKANFTSHVAQLLDRSKSVLTPMLFETTWSSSEYTDVTSVKQMFEQLRLDEADPVLIWALWRIITTEIWLRHIKNNK